MKRLRNVNMVVVHCAATNPLHSISVEDIRRWHVEENGWEDIGYHYYIKRDGSVYKGRPTMYQGAHEPKANDCSLAICLEGGHKGDSDYTDDQFYALRRLIGEIREVHPHAAVLGHNQFRHNKTCPNFDVVSWWEAEILQEQQ